MATRTMIPKAITAAIRDGVVEALQVTLQAEALKRHDLRGMLDAQGNKLHDLDTEVRLLKGAAVSLVGGGDGSTGLVPRMEREMGELKEDVSALRGEMRQVRSEVSAIMEGIKGIRESQTGSKAFMDGWKGVAVAVAIVGTCVTVGGTFIAAAVWLWQHGSMK